MSSRKKSLIAWNVNGIRAAERKGFLDYLEQGKYDIVAIQETKIDNTNLLSPQLMNPNGYSSYWCSDTERKGYSGVAVFCREAPLRVKTHFGRKSLLSLEGRMIELEFPEFILLNIYFPNGGRSEARLEYKLKFYDQFLKYVTKLDQAGKKIIFTGDLNTAHHELDLARPKENINNSGFMPKERVWLDKFEQSGFIDTFRYFHPTKIKYSFWDQKTRARDRNVGWRIDYFYVNQRFLSKVKQADINDDVLGSDHAPVQLMVAV